MCIFPQVGTSKSPVPFAEERTYFSASACVDTIVFGLAMIARVSARVYHNGSFWTFIMAMASCLFVDVFLFPGSYFPSNIRGVLNLDVKLITWEEMFPALREYQLFPELRDEQFEMRCSTVLASVFECLRQLLTIQVWLCFKNSQREKCGLFSSKSWLALSHSNSPQLFDSPNKQFLAV